MSWENGCLVIETSPFSPELGKLTTFACTSNDKSCTGSTFTFSHPAEKHFESLGVATTSSSFRDIFFLTGLNLPCNGHIIRFGHVFTI